MRLWSGMLVAVCLMPLMISFGQRLMLRRAERSSTARTGRRLGPADAASSAYYQGAELDDDALQRRRRRIRIQAIGGLLLLVALFIVNGPPC